MHPESPPGSWYVVERGETLEQIAARAGVPAEDILELNGLTQASEVRAGRIIYVLAGPGSPAPDRGATPAESPAPAQRPALAERAAPDDRRLPFLASGRLASAESRFRWPLGTAAIGSPFGTRDGRLHEGIDLPAPIGTPVYAAGDGQVIYAGDGIRGYGHLIVLQHEGDLLTVYAHNAELLVKEGEKVTTGQRIALVGQSGRATGPHLHFEVRAGQVPQDPLSYLPSPGSLSGPNPKFGVGGPP
jgi:murein DD-endopeptidase MepM/ murein hydrolase activator NlpD